jgi:hypothetical protein
VPPEAVGGYLRDLRRLFDRYGYQASLYGHFGQGCVHCRISFVLRTAEGVDKYRHFVYDAARLVTRHAGSISGEHGDGQARAEVLAIMFGDELVCEVRHGRAEARAQEDETQRIGGGWAKPPVIVVSQELRLVALDRSEEDGGRHAEKPASPWPPASPYSCSCPWTHFVNSR